MTQIIFFLLLVLSFLSPVLVNSQFGVLSVDIPYATVCVSTIDLSGTPSPSDHMWFCHLLDMILEIYDHENEQS